MSKLGKHETKFVQACLPIGLYKNIRDAALERRTTISGLIRDILEAWEYNQERRSIDGQKDEQDN